MRRSLASWFRRAVGRGRSLASDFAAAQLALGKQMYAAGIDDGVTGAHIAALDEAARRTGAGSQALLAERERLLRRLADAALEDDAPLPGADAQYATARQILTALREHHS